MSYKPMTGDKFKSMTKPDLDELKQADQLPGERILAYRKAAQLTQRVLADKCNPPMDFSSIGRIEKNQGYTSSTLHRLAAALECEVADFFIPYEMILWRHLNDDDKKHISDTIQRFWESSQTRQKDAG